MFNFEIKIEGLDKLIKHFEKLQKSIKRIEGEYGLTFDELFPPEFLQRNTRFSSLDEMFEKSGFIVNSRENFKKIPHDVWNKFISDNSKFDSWQDMLNAAVKEWVERQLFNKLS